MSDTLSKFKVLDLTNLLSGPFCTKMLADLGADVVKIEKPVGGDDSRLVGPFVNGESLYFIEQNRNKRSVVIDLKTESGRSALKKMVLHADVLVENYRPGTMQKFGLDYDALKKLNPRLVYATIKGYAKTSSKFDQAAYDATIQAECGIMSITGKAGGEYMKIGTSVLSMVSGLMLDMGILAALFERESSGMGQKIEVSMYNAGTAILENPLLRYMYDGIIPMPNGNSNPVACPFSSFHTANGDIVIATTVDEAWVRLCEAMEHTELTSDPRFITMEQRAHNWPALEQAMNDILKCKPMDDWIRRLREFNVVCGTIGDIKSLLVDPQAQDREMFLDMEHPIAGKVKVTGMPIKLSRTPCTIRRSAPMFGEHTEEILSKYGELK